MPNKAELAGRRFNRLTVLKESGKSSDGKILWMCRCQCGNVTNVSGSKLLSGHTQSCGCYMRDKAREMASKHGQAGRGSLTRFYRIWENMKKRCGNPNIPAYQRYGARGIIVCEKWRTDFVNFLKDMHASYVEHATIYGEKETTLDRIDNSKGYSPENCRWATYREQNNNRRRRVS